MASNQHSHLPTGLLSGILFFAVVALGSGYIVFSKLHSLPAIYVTAVPIAIMMGYALLLGVARLFRLRDDQSGDNLYYMGFLFTLTSLAVSLHQFNISGSADQIVQNFGIAIASTIAGIALRVLFNQMRRDPAEVEATARLELAEAARKVRAELESTVLEFSYFRRMAQQSVAEALEEVQDLLKEARETFTDQLDKFAREATKPLGNASRQATENVEEISAKLLQTSKSTADKLSGDSERLSKSMAALAAALEAMSSKLKAMQTPDSVIEIKLQPMVQGLSRAVNAFTKATEDNSETINLQIERLDGMARAVTDLTNQLRRQQALSERQTLMPWGRGKDGDQP